jgi:5-methylcytosine-specific restriction endonuclease McrA
MAGVTASKLKLAVVPPPLAPVTRVTTFHNHRTLVLNADYQPLGWPLETLGAEDTIRGIWLERFVVVAGSNTVAHSPTRDYLLPSVVALRDYVNPLGLYGTPSLNLYNLYIRDRATCQYTGRTLRLHSPHKSDEATADHVIPRCQQGKDVWDNLVLASWEMNNRKGSKRPEHFEHALRGTPWTPTGADLLYLWLTEDKLAEMPVAWQEFLSIIRPSPRLQRVLGQAA